MSQKGEREATRKVSEPYQKNVDVNVRTEDAQTLENFRSVIVHRDDRFNIASYGTNVKERSVLGWTNLASMRGNKR